MKYRSEITLYIDHDDEIDPDIISDLARRILRGPAKTVLSGRAHYMTGHRANGEGVPT